MALSEVTEFRQRQATQEEAAQLGLHGFASGYSRHDFIEARMDRGAQHILQLLEEGKEEEAQQLMSTRSWGEEELEGIEEEGEVERCHISIVSSHKHIL